MKLTRQKVGLVSLCITALASGSAVKAQHRAQDDLYIICYAAFQNGSPNFNHVNIREVPTLKVNKGAVFPNAGNDRLANSLKQKMIEMLGPDAINRAACTTYIHESRARNMREKNALQIEWPFDPMEELSRFVDADYPGRLKTKDPSRTDQKPKAAEIASAALKPTAAPSKYVEVAGPNGIIRLSPEVAARNQAAADEYRRKMDEHASAKAEHERKLALHQQSIAAAAAEKRAYEQKLALNDAQVAAHGAALEQHKTATMPPAKGAKGWMYCDARGAPGDKRRYYSRVTEIDYAPGEITIIDVMAKNRPAFKSYVAGAHSIFFATDSLLHCPYSTTSLADAEALMARDKRGDGNNSIEIIQTGWVPAS